jgi:endonuclease/exonuclease/phosphatase family metal-dependent hydrolase
MGSTMAKPLKIMTWNVQQLPGDLAPGDPTDRAEEAVRLIGALPQREAPDVITFNEVFDGDARDVFANGLKSQYPHFHKIFGKPSIPFRQDSGLAIFSKQPFLPLATGGKSRFKKFKRSEFPDSMSNKGVAFVKLQGPNGHTVIGLTHLQAGRNNSAERIRKSQLAQIHTETRGVANTTALLRNTILLGDLNVIGQANATTGEYQTTFVDVTNTFGHTYTDAWPHTVRSPGDRMVHDPGNTQENDDAAHTLRRLDYACMSRNAIASSTLAAHHMYIAIRPALSVSDHWAVMARIHRTAEHCAPSTARMLVTETPVEVLSVNQKLWRGTAAIADEGMYVWLYLDSPGTYSVFTEPSIECAAYSQSDVSHPLISTGLQHVADLPPAFASHLSIFTTGMKYTLTTSSFVRLRGATETFSGQATFAIAKLS